MNLGREGFRRLCQARDLLCEPDEHPRSIREIANEVGVSPFHFIRQFKAVFGATPHQFRIRARLERAKELLAAGRLSVTEICFEVGMESLGSFSELFSRRVGEAPSDYGRRRQEMAAPGALLRDHEPGCLSLMGLLPDSPQFSRSANGSGKS